MAIEELVDFTKNGNKLDYKGENEDFFLGTSENKFAQIDIKKQNDKNCEISIGDNVFKIPQITYDLLMKHQQEALNWLLEQNLNNRGSILADEMGLGKTISAIALISC